MAFRTTLEIARKEFLENVLSWKFLIALVLSTLILVTSVLALGASYAEEQRDYSVQQAELEEQAEQWSYSKTLQQIHRVLAKPNPLSIFVGGPGDTMRTASSNGGTGSPDGSLGSTSGSGSPANLRFNPLDLGFVVVVVMTFNAVIFAYDAVSGERERGTLKLMLANPVPKDSILVGKYLGGMASILMPFVVSFTIGVAVLQSRGISLGGAEWAAVGIVLGLFLLLVSAFYLVGLLVSSIVRRSSTSLIALTLVWLVLVFGVGNVAAVVAKETTDTMTDTEMQEHFRAIEDRARNLAQENDDAMREIWDRAAANNGTLTEDDQELLETLQERNQAVWEEAQKEREAVQERARRQLDNQLLRAEAIAAFSPAEAFRSLATAVAGSDYWTYKTAREAAEAYSKEVQEAEREWWEEHNGGGGFPGPIIIDPMRSEATVATEAGDQKIAPGEPEPGIPGFPSEPREQFQPPPFTYKAQTAAEKVETSGGIRDLLVLLAYNVVAFLGAYAAFLRYDVR